MSNRFRRMRPSDVFGVLTTFAVVMLLLRGEFYLALLAALVALTCAFWLIGRR